MKADLERTIKFLNLIFSNQRIRVERIQKECGLSRSAAYRWLNAAALVLPIRLEDGVIIRKNP
jgi:predicted DNA-binding transcriptional regulator YafY